MVAAAGTFRQLLLPTIRRRLASGPATFTRNTTMAQVWLIQFGLSLGDCIANQTGSGWENKDIGNASIVHPLICTNGHRADNDMCVQLYMTQSTTNQERKE
jgi:hypothetical protein